MKLRHKSTKKESLLRFFIYYDKKEHEYVGVCIDLGIIKCGENPYHVEQDLVDAALGYVETIEQEELPDYLLNQKPPQEYLTIFKKLIRATVSHSRYVSQKPQVDFNEARTFLKKVPA